MQKKIERSNCKYFRRHDMIERATGKDSNIEVVEGFYCTKRMPTLGGCPENCEFFEEE